MLTVAAFVPKKVKISVTEEEVANKKDEVAEEDEDLIQKIITELPDPKALTGADLQPIDFEKDVDTNFHMDFVTAAANLRATNYGIPVADKHKAKGIAGKIIPAMVTTTAVVCGLSCIELIKILQKKKLDQMKNGFISILCT